MSDYDSVLTVAKKLPERERVRLIDALLDTVPADTDAEFWNEWKHEIERRAAELDAGTAKTVSWSVVKNDALARIGHGKGN